jgi:hypothetical protein
MDFNHTTMKLLKNRLKRYQRTLKEIFYYSDNEVLDIAIALATIFINPFTMDRVPDTPEIWSLFGVFGGIVLFIGVLERHLSFRYWGNKIIWLFLITILGQCAWCWCWSTDIMSYIVQLIVVWYSMWRNCKQLNFYKTRKA